MKIPCENCMILPICRHKHIVNMLRDCPPAEKYFFQETRLNHPHAHRHQMRKVLKPTQWSLGTDGKIIFQF
jgi:hypothetical protein